ncbi:MAG: hypothetical protein KY432_09110 [Acidobacteria bacterium]|nr:hypothetical protein [Acidobacteriota bacterium]
MPKLEKSTAQASEAGKKKEGLIEILRYQIGRGPDAREGTVKVIDSFAKYVNRKDA